LSKERVFTEERSKFYATEIILAVQYLHEQSVVYRDLKVAKILGQKFEQAWINRLVFSAGESLAGCRRTHKDNRLWFV
jgi:serine/threonine protein kinase